MLATRIAEEKDTQWFREAKFGMFITWDIGAVYGAADESHKWGKTPFGEFGQLKGCWTAEKFDADKFLGLAKSWGFKYIIPTAVHGDGFCLWDTKTSDFKCTTSAAGRDILRELSSACCQHGVYLGVYYNPVDWSHSIAQEVYTPEEPWRQDRIWDWDKEDYSIDSARLIAFGERSRERVRELLTNYGPIKVFWHDAPPRNSFWWNTEMFRRLIYDLQPGIIQNTRFHWPDDGPVQEPWGDFFTPEQNVLPSPPTHKRTPVLWELCLTSTSEWMNVESEMHFKSARTIVRALFEAVSKGGNLLLNVSPDAKGDIPKTLVGELDKVGAWLKTNGEAVWGTTAGPRWDVPNVAMTRNGNTLYVSYYGSEKSFVLPGFGATLVGASVLATGQTVRVEDRGRDMVISLDGVVLDLIGTVIRLDFGSEPVRIEADPRFPPSCMAESSWLDHPEPTQEDWASAQWKYITGQTGTAPFARQPKPHELSFRFAVLNDGENLYVKVDLRKSSVRKDEVLTERPVDAMADLNGVRGVDLGGQAWVQLYFDALPPSPEVLTDGRCFGMNIHEDGRSEVAWAGSDRAVEHSVRVARHDNGFDVVCKIPIRALVKDYDWREDRREYDLSNFFGLPRTDQEMGSYVEPVSAGDVIGFNVSASGYFDGIGAQPFKQSLWWMARFHSPYNDPHQWGRLRLARCQSVGSPSGVPVKVH